MACAARRIAGRKALRKFTVKCLTMTERQAGAGPRHNGPVKISQVQRLSRKKSHQSVEISGAAEGTRTPDPIITNDVLYQLSYSGTLFFMR